MFQWDLCNNLSFVTSRVFSHFSKIRNWHNFFFYLICQYFIAAFYFCQIFVLSNNWSCKCVGHSVFSQQRFRQRTQTHRKMFLCHIILFVKKSFWLLIFFLQNFLFTKKMSDSTKIQNPAQGRPFNLLLYAGSSRDTKKSKNKPFNFNYFYF